MARLAGAGRGDMFLMVADQAAVANRALDALRRELGDQLHLADPDTLAFAFVVQYPQFQWSETEGRWGLFPSSFHLAAGGGIFLS